MRTTWRAHPIDADDGAPERRILDLADAHLGSVIVMSTHGRGRSRGQRWAA